MSNRAARGLAPQVGPFRAMVFSYLALVAGHAAWWAPAVGAMNRPYTRYAEYFTAIAETALASLVVGATTALLHLGLLGLTLAKTSRLQTTAGLLVTPRALALVLPYSVATAVAVTASPNFGVPADDKPEWTLHPAWVWATRWWADAALVTVTLIHAYWVAHSVPAPHLCASCGYDLRGTIAARIEQCPECGASVTPHLVKL